MVSSNFHFGQTHLLSSIALSFYESAAPLVMIVLCYHFIKMGVLKYSSIGKLLWHPKSTNKKLFPLTIASYTIVICDLYLKKSLADAIGAYIKICLPSRAQTQCGIFQTESNILLIYCQSARVVGTKKLLEINEYLHNTLYINLSTT